MLKPLSVRTVIAIVLVVLAVFFVFSFAKLRSHGRTKGISPRWLFQSAAPVSRAPSPTFNAENGPDVRAIGNPFGVMFADANKITLAKDLGVAYYRPISAFIDGWDKKGCSECDAASEAGFALILTVRNNGGPKNPTSPPTNLETYKRTLGKILDTYRPVVLVVENEENSTTFYTGTPQQYYAETQAACEVAHSKGIKCTNGGLVSSLVALLVADNYYEQGQITKADEYLNRTLGSRLPEYGVSSMEEILKTPKFNRLLEKGKVLLSGYKSSGVDYINFHWYIADTSALAEAVDYLEKTTGLEAMTNEIGQQKSEDPVWVTSVMQKVVELKLPYAVWFSLDILDPNFAGARSLVNKNGTFRPNGTAFKNFITETF